MADNFSSENFSSGTDCHNNKDAETTESTVNQTTDALHLRLFTDSASAGAAGDPSVTSSVPSAMDTSVTSIGSDSAHSASARTAAQQNKDGSGGGGGGARKSNTTSRQESARSRERDEKVRAARERADEEARQRAEQLQTAQRKAREFRDKQQQERQQRIDELRQRDSSHRAIVEERKRRIAEEEQKKRAEIVRRSQDRESKFEQIRHSLRQGAAASLGFGSRAPRNVCQPVTQPVNHVVNSSSVSTTAAASSASTRRSASHADLLTSNDNRVPAVIVTADGGPPVARPATGRGGPRRAVSSYNVRRAAGPAQSAVSSTRKTQDTSMDSPEEPAPVASRRPPRRATSLAHLGGASPARRRLGSPRAGEHTTSALDVRAGAVSNEHDTMTTRLLPSDDNGDDAYKRHSSARRPNSSQSDNTPSSGDRSPTRRSRPHSIIGRLPNYASPTLASEARASRSTDKKQTVSSQQMALRSKSADTGLRRARSSGADLQKTFDRLAQPKQQQLTGSASNVAKETTDAPLASMRKSHSDIRRISERLAQPKQQQQVAQQSGGAAVQQAGARASQSPVKARLARHASPAKSPAAAKPAPPKVLNVPRVVPREVPIKSPAKSTPIKGPVKAVHKSTPNKISTPSPRGPSPSVEQAPTVGAAEEAVGLKKQEEDYKAKLAERRRQAREEAERKLEEQRQADEEKRRLEEEARLREEEEDRRREEEALAMAAEARKAEEDRLQRAIEENEARQKLEAEKAEQERQAKEEAERLAREEAEKREREATERRKKEEEERVERKKRLESIMKRVKPDSPEHSAKQADAAAQPVDPTTAIATPPDTASPLDASPDADNTSSASSPSDPAATSITEESTADPGTPQKLAPAASTLAAADSEKPAQFKSPLLQQMLGKKRFNRVEGDESAQSPAATENVTSPQDEDSQLISGGDVPVNGHAEEAVKTFVPETPDSAASSKNDESQVSSPVDENDIQLNGVVDEMSATPPSPTRVTDISKTENGLGDRVALNNSTNIASLNGPSSEQQVEIEVDNPTIMDASLNNLAQVQIDSSLGATTLSDELGDDSSPAVSPHSSHTSERSESPLDQIIELGSISEKHGFTELRADNMTDSADLLNSNIASGMLPPISNPLIAFEENSNMKKDSFTGLLSS